MYSSGSFEIFSNSCNTLGLSVDKLNSSIHSDYSCGGSDKGGGGGGPGGLVVLSSRDHKEIEEEAQANHSILNARRKYHYQNKALYIDSNMTNCIRPVRTFFSGL